MKNRKAILNTSKREYIITDIFPVGTKEENEAKRLLGKSFSTSGFGKERCSAYISKEGKPFGRHFYFYTDELTFLDEATS